MTRRRERRKKKFLGSRHCGAGNIKNRRGKGSRGGKGYAGSHKHRWTYIVKYEPDHFGVGGFHNPTVTDLPVINLWRINELAEKGELKKKEGKLSFEFDGKILGSGVLSHAVSITATSFSASAKEKISKAGGHAISKYETKGAGE